MNVTLVMETETCLRVVNKTTGEDTGDYLLCKKTDRVKSLLKRRGIVAETIEIIEGLRL